MVEIHFGDISKISSLSYTIFGMGYGTQSSYLTDI